MKILLTGLPKSGKTTLLANLLADIHPKHGMVAKEVLEGGARIGFDLQDERGHRATLSRVGNQRHQQGDLHESQGYQPPLRASIKLTPSCTKHIHQGHSFIYLQGYIFFLYHMDMGEANGNVFFYRNDGNERLARHEISRLSDLGGIIAGMKQYVFAGEFQPDNVNDGNRYFIPGKTLLQSDADALGIESEDDFYGGIAPNEHALTKAITHVLIHPDAAHPKAWSHEFSEAVSDIVLPGFTVFTKEDAIKAVERLLQEGHIARAKRTLAAGGTDQFVITSPNDINEVWERVSPSELQEYGLVIEASMQDFQIYAAARVSINGIHASCVGTVREFSADGGQKLFGGTDALIVRGAFSKLVPKIAEDEKALQAVEKISKFHEAAQRHLGLVASRSAYTVLMGRGNDGRNYAGVLEQSWRIGGSSGPEILALDAFQKNPSLEAVRGSSRNLLGAATPIPADARIHYKGDDTLGHVTVFSTIQEVG